MTRAIVSTPPPAGYGTISVIALAGKVCALASDAWVSTAKSDNATVTEALKPFMLLLLFAALVSHLLISLPPSIPARR